MQFSLTVGLEYHPSGLGAWELALTHTGELSAIWKRGQITSFGPFQLGREENARVWGLIESIHIPASSPPQRLGLPDEVRYIFIFQLDETSYTLELWHGDLPHLPEAQALVVEINGLNEKYTRHKAYL
ncbi:MAG TPA: hypothetical protein PK530_04325 [Anaerolineales bacterium]|nr:hypothetical protein [Anaerolineales bacterium]